VRKIPYRPPSPAPCIHAKAGGVAREGPRPRRRQGGKGIEPAIPLFFGTDHRFATAGARNARAPEACLASRVSKSTAFDLSRQGQASYHATDSGFHVGFDGRF
jgi:hypothetical protein